jgi:hypothetical protein
VGLRLAGQLAGASRRRIAGIEHDLAAQRLLQVPPELRQRVIGNREQQDRAELSRLERRACRSARTELAGHGDEFLGMAGGEQHFVSGPHPEPPDRAAQPARADDTEAHGLRALPPRRLLAGLLSWCAHGARARRDRGQSESRDKQLTAVQCMGLVLSIAHI